VVLNLQHTCRLVSQMPVQQLACVVLQLACGFSAGAAAVSPCCCRAAGFHMMFKSVFP